VTVRFATPRALKRMTPHDQEITLRWCAAQRRDSIEDVLAGRTVQFRETIASGLVSMQSRLRLPEQLAEQFDLDLPKAARDAAVREVKQRDLLEIAPKKFVSATPIDNPNTALEALLFVKMGMRGVLHGRGPLFGREALLALCADEIEEDFDRPQTLCIGYDEGRS
jgi:hypothetical protein